MAPPRSAAALDAGLRLVCAALPDLPAELVVNELEPAARSLRPDIAEGLETARGAGADLVLVSGSGPTVLGLFEKPDGAGRAARALGGRALACRTVGEDFAEVRVA